MVDQSEQQPANVQPAEAQALLEGQSYTLLDVRRAAREPRIARTTSCPQLPPPVAAAREGGRRRPLPVPIPYFELPPLDQLWRHTTPTGHDTPPPPCRTTWRRTPEEHAQGSVPGSINIPVKLDDGQGGFVDNPQFLEQARHLQLAQCIPAESLLLRPLPPLRSWVPLCSGARSWSACSFSSSPNHSPILPQVKEQVGLDKPLVCTCAHGAPCSACH